MNIQMNPSLYDALLERLRREIGDLMIVNQTQDIVLEGLVQENQKLSSHNQALVEANTNLRRDNDELRKHVERPRKSAKTTG